MTARVSLEEIVQMQALVSAGRSYAEVSAATGRAISTVWNAVHREDRRVIARGRDRKSSVHMDDTRVEAARILREHGWVYQRIAYALGVSFYSVYRTARMPRGGP